MGWDGVPWIIGGGAEHTANVARNVAYAAFGGRQGIVNPTDLEVRELAVPGTEVRVFPGTCAIKNQAAGARDEMYVGRLPTEDRVPIAATDGLGGRSDLIIARVENSSIQSEPWDPPADVLNGPYIFTRVIENVPATTTSVDELGLNFSALTLARVDLPASTGTVTQAMVTDLRKLSQSQSDRQLGIIGSIGDPQTMDGAAFSNFPRGANFAVEVPPWATHIKAVATLAGIGYSGNVVGDLRIQVGFAPEEANYSQNTRFNVSTVAGVDRATLMAGAANLAIPASLRGKTATVRVEARKTAGSDALTVDDKAMATMDVEFVRNPTSNI